MGINIRINNDWAITSDPNQFILNRIKTRESDKIDNDTGEIIWKAGDEYYQSNGYYYTMESALSAIPGKALKESNMTGSLNDIVTFLQCYRDMIERSLSSQYGYLWA